MLSGPSAPPPETAPADHGRRPRVVYVMGAGRSGSTILGITLGNCEGVFFAGELARWHRRAGEPLAGAEREQFWSAAFDIGGWPAQRRLRGRYRRVTEDLYRAIARTAEATHIVDTSHFPRRARELQALSGIDLYLLLLVRDPQSIVAAHARTDVVQGPGFGTLTTNAYLWLTYLLSLLVFLRHPRKRRLLVRYEAFIANPEVVLQEILDQIEAPAAIPDLQALRTNVGFLGNRVLEADVVTLKRQLEPPAHRSRVTTFLQLPWRVVFSRLRPAVSG
jgi:hypothetical protein